MPKKLRRLYSIEYLIEANRLKDSICHWENFFAPENDTESRIQSWIRLEIVGQCLMDKYSWAIPDSRSLRILSNFSPLIEIGCGKAYWAYLLRNRGVDIIAVDKYVDPTTCWTNIVTSGPEILSHHMSKGRNLFLCYPDDTENMAIDCLDNFEGDYIIHVGELVACGGTFSGAPQAPFGRTTSSEFQIQLMEDFHCLLIVDLPRFPFSKDTLSVWKRTTFSPGKSFYIPPSSNVVNEDSFEASVLSGDPGVLEMIENKSGSNNESSGEDNESIDENIDEWAFIPLEERLPTNLAAPCMLQFLQ